jgi:threonyl-tRNA synthetase
VDGRTESLKKKVREAQINKIPLILTIGEKEKESGNLSVRTLDGNVKFGVDRAVFLEQVTAHVKERKLEMDLFA